MTPFDAGYNAIMAKALFSSNKGKKYIRVIIDGDITGDARHSLAGAMEGLANENVHGAILDINSGGGSAGTEVANLISIAREKYGKPIVAYASGEVASLAYLIASRADKIVASKGSKVGSIGVYSTPTIIPTASDINANSDVLSPRMLFLRGGDKKLNDAEGEQKIVADAYEHFINDVAMARNLSLEDVSKWGDGRIFTASEAVKLGLIDGIGTLQNAYDILDNILEASSNPPAAISVIEASPNNAYNASVAASTSGINQQIIDDMNTEEIYKKFDEFSEALTAKVTQAIEGLKAVAAVPQVDPNKELESELTARKEELLQVKNSMIAELKNCLSEASPVVSMLDSFSVAQLQALSKEYATQASKKTNYLTPVAHIAAAPVASDAVSDAFRSALNSRQGGAA